jgi:Eco57I restriction-modification methylase
MTAPYANLQKRLQNFDFKGLFTQELMWNHFQARDLEIKVDGLTYTLTPVAQRGMAVYECAPPTDADFPKYAIRRKIDTLVSKTAREHIIIFHDRAKTVQVWQWVKREAGKQSACREQLFYKGQAGDALIQKIQSIAFSLEDEPNVAETVEKVGAAFDVEKVTKRFYELFKKEHDTFLKFVDGIPDQELKRWYVSVMLNRLMFIYFIQKKGFLGGELQYLTNKLTESKRQGKDKFYRQFLCPLFFEGFAKRPEQRTAGTNRLLGQVPYLNGGLFLRHQIEELHGKSIDMPDRAFDRIFDFFEQYDWHLDDRPTRTGREINPDVLGYVFEKYINQKEMGAYYSKEDITGFIGDHTIIPALFDMAHKSCKIAFEGECSIWRLLQADPDRYIHAPVLKGTNKELPKSIAAGLKDVHKRADWNRVADSEYGLLTETWREVIARRDRCEETRKKLASGGIRSTNDLITYNLDIRRFAEEAIANCEGTELLRAFYKAIRTISVLDPACGSGAFLFAALNILERLYDTCLVRMQAFVDDLDRSGEKHNPDKLKDFRQTLEEMNDKQRHPSPRYFILKSIILNNLYGVDIMEEATEICKLRLFLKLVSQVDDYSKIEPLPDIDFNIQAGNTLVGFASEDDLLRVLGGKLDFDNTIDDVKERAQLAELAYERFRDMQVAEGMSSSDFSVAKAELVSRLRGLREQLDGYLAGEYGLKRNDRKTEESWRRSHVPFHWLVAFYGIMRKGGFDVVIGNPPYVEYAKVKATYKVKNYQTEDCSNLYAFLCERSVALLRESGRLGMIVPMSAISTDRMLPLRNMLEASNAAIYVSSYSGDAHPAILFSGVKMRLSIIITEKRVKTSDSVPDMFSTGFIRWYSEARPTLFETVHFADTPSELKAHGLIPKAGDKHLVSIITKVKKQPTTFGQWVLPNSQHCIYAHRIVAHFVKCFDFVPFFKNDRDGQKKSEDYKVFAFGDKTTALVASAVLNSNLFYLYYLSYSDAYHCGRELILNFPCDLEKIRTASGDAAIRANKALMSDLRKNAQRRRIEYHGTGWIEYDEFYPKRSKAYIDEIDRILCPLYDLSEEEVDYVLNFDVKFRLGQEQEDEESEEQSAVETK